MRRVAIASVVVLVAVVSGSLFLSLRSEESPPPITAAVGLEPIADFGTGTIIVDGATEWPVMVADTADLRARGLMNVTGLGDFAGMAFVWDEAVRNGFWMKDTLLPLTIFWVDASGAVVAVAEMEPCPADEQDCPRWRPSMNYVLALEVPTSAVGGLGITSVTKLELRL